MGPIQKFQPLWDQHGAIIIITHIQFCPGDRKMFIKSNICFSQILFLFTRKFKWLFMDISIVNYCIQYSIFFLFFQENHFTMISSLVSFSERVCFVLYSLICFNWLMPSWCILKDFSSCSIQSLSAIDVSFEYTVKTFIF